MRIAILTFEGFNVVDAPFAASGNVAPVGEKDSYVTRVLDVVRPFMKKADLAIGLSVASKNPA